LWNAKGNLFERSDRTNEALRAFTEAIELAATDLSVSGKTRVEALHHRSGVLQRMGLMAEAGADNCAALGIPTRDPRAAPALLDLSLFYNSTLYWTVTRHAEQKVAQEVERTTGVEFDVRAQVKLGGRGPLKYGLPPKPQSATNIPVNRRFARMHFLHGMVFGDPDGTKIGAYTVHYADGQSQEVPIIYGEDMRAVEASSSLRPRKSPDPELGRAENKRLGAKEEVQPPRSQVAWTGGNPSGARTQRVRFYLMTWQNPRPEQEVRSLDFASSMKDSAPFLIAVTVNQ